jgi:hypothetical protein
MADEEKSRLRNLANCSAFIFVKEIFSDKSVLFASIRVLTTLVSWLSKSANSKAFG